MADLLSVVRMRPRFTVRTQAAFARAQKFLNISGSDHLTQFNIRALPRLHDMNPSVYVCALTLLDQRVEKDPEIIRESRGFAALIDRLGLQPSSPKKDVKNGYKASLILLEVFTYMVIIDRARSQEEEVKAAREEDYHEELTF